MGGKASILLVLGFSLIFLVVGYNFGNLSTRSVRNSANYYVKSKAHNIAVSGANMALNEIFDDSTWTAGYSNLPFDGGEINVTVNLIGGNKEVLATSEYSGTEDTIKVVLKPSTYSKFAWYISNMNSKTFVTGDTIWGPFHTQSALNIEGDPVFWGKVTTLRGTNPKDKNLKNFGYDPKFYGGYESGVDIPLPSNYQFTEQSAAAIDAVANMGGSSYFDATDLWVHFNGDGSVTYRTGIGKDTSTYNPPITQSLTTMAPNGIIYVKKGDIYVSGVLDGQVSVVAGESSGTGDGNIYLVDDITYKTDPVIWNAAESKYVPNKNCDDLLGIMATNNVRIVDNDHNNKDKNISIDGSIFCAQGGFELDNKLMPPSGTLYLQGGVIAMKEELIAETDNHGNITNGYKRNVKFDERLLLKAPPYFPATNDYEIVSWYE